MSVRRTIKNVVYNYSDAARKVREATSNDPWGPSTSLMQNIAELTYNMVAYSEIMPVIWKRLNDHGKNWRHVYKSLVLLDHLIKNGSKKVAQQCKENIFAIQTLKDFQYIEGNKDQGLNVREKAKQLVSLLKDDERLKNERAKADALRQHFMENRGSSSHDFYSGRSSGAYGSSHGTSFKGDANLSEYARPTNAEEEAIQIQLALALSKEEAEEEARKRKTDSIKLSMAMNESLKHEKLFQDTGKHASENDLVNIFEGNAWEDGKNNNNYTSLVNRPVSANPWISQPRESGSANGVWGAPSTPWSPINSTSKSNNIDPWGLPAPALSSSPPNDQFSALAISRQGEASNNKETLSQSFDMTKELKELFDNPSSNATSWDFYNLTGVAPSDPVDSLPSANSGNETQKIGKDPVDFLGEHKSLVNLDDLTKKTKSSNPFSIPSVAGVKPTFNPFMQTNKPPTLNELSQSTSASASNLPPPLKPVDLSKQTKETSEHSSYNPFR